MLKLVNENTCAGNNSGKKRKYGYDDLRHYPFGIMERCEEFSDEDVIRIRDKIKELDNRDCDVDDEGK